MRTLSIAALMLGSALAASGCATTSMQQAACDRDCLIDTTDAYIAALVAGDPSQAPLAADIVTVENITRIAPGEGLWANADDASDSFAIYVPDPMAQAAGYLGIMTLDGGPQLVALRLQLEGGEIVEAEHVITTSLREEVMGNFEAPRPGLLAEIPPGERLRRDQLVSIAGTYYDALEGENGSLSPFAEDCERRENGIRTAYPGDWENIAPTEFGYFSAVGCERQLDTGVLGYIDRLDNRRVFAADPVTGLAMGFSQFRHAMDFDTIPIFNVPGVTERAVNFDAFDLPAAHVYKIGPEGRIHEIEAMGFQAPYLAPTGWE